MYGLVLLISVVAAIVPALTYLMIVRWLERLQREPLRVLLLVMAWGAIGGTALGITFARFVEGAAVLWRPGGVSDIAEYAVYVPLAEEMAKGLVLLWLATSPRLRTRANGLVYGVAVGLGFAITENLVYSIHVYNTVGVEGWYMTTVLRMFFASTIHAIASALFGLALAWGQIEFRGRPRPVVGAFVGLLVAIMVHGSWNAIHFADRAAGDGGAGAMAYVSTPVLAALMVGIAWWVLRREREG